MVVVESGLLLRVSVVKSAVPSELVVVICVVSSEMIWFELVVPSVVSAEISVVSSKMVVVEKRVPSGINIVVESEIP